MIRNEIDPQDEWVLSIDRYINLKSQSRADVYGWLMGMLIFSIVLIIFLLNVVHISSKNFLYFVFSPFPITYFFGKANQFGWRTDRYLKSLVDKGDVSDCFCDLKRLPPYPDLGWKKTRYREFYSCIVYSFISSFLMGCCLVSLLWLIFNMFK